LKSREAESVQLTCLVDNSVDILLSNTEVARRAPIRDDWSTKPLIAEHGFSAVLTLEDRGRRRKILFDSGLDPHAASQNAEVLDLDLGDCEAVISSHGHVDHTGGLLNIKNRIGKTQMPLLMHPYAFRNRSVKFPDGRTFNLRPPDKKKLSEAGYNVVEKKGPSLWVDDFLLVTGQIPRTNDFEKGMPIHYAEVDGKLEPDPLIEDDQALVLLLRDKGLVVVTGCAHAGLINTLSYAKELTGEDRIYGVIGGMHLTGGLFEPIISRTITELKKIKPRFVIPCHCTGVRAVNEIMNQMPDSFIQNSVGTTYTFSSM
jgi:7,8-dihydropterin-6-yl-methyl-4-(beta-D-ribofuranosyl)aminobenzene 5'-phosphate synthase